MSSSKADRLQNFKKFTLIALLAFAAVEGIILFKAKDQKQVVHLAKPPLVIAYKLQESKGINFELTGTVKARTEVSLGFRIAGKITKKFVEDGQKVVKGQPLMEIDRADLDLAQKAAQQSALAAKAENTRALQDEKRQRDLLKEQVISIQEYERAKSIADASTAQLRAVEAESRKVSNQAEYAILYANADGVITNVSAEIGQVVAIGQTVVTLAHDDFREAVVNLTETMLSQANKAKSATLYGDSKKKIPVKLRELSAVADPMTRTYQARYTLQNNGKKATLGATVTVLFESENHETAKQGYQVPLGSLYDGGHGVGVWLIDEKESTVSLQPVKIIELGEDFAIVSGDLQPGANIVGLGANLLKAGDKVRTLSTEESLKQ